MKILVPTDFSASSKNAAEYASKIATKINAEITLLHLVYRHALPHASILKENLERVMKQNAKQDCIELVNELRSKNKSLLISYKIMDDFDFENVIENYAVHNNIDLIIMGTRGATGLSKVIFGSNTASVISHSSVPVIAVPEHARFNGIKNIIYASDLHFLEKELPAVIPFAQQFDAGLHIFHVLKPNSEKKFDKDKLVKELTSKFRYTKITVSFSLHSDIEDGIAEFISQNQGDLLVMFTHNVSFFEKLFAKSYTRELAFQTRLPLLTFKKQLAVDRKKGVKTDYALD